MSDTSLTIDLSFFRRKPLLRVGHEATLLHLVALCHARAEMTDGQVDEGYLPVLAAYVGLDADLRYVVVGQLVDNGLWNETPDGWAIVGYLDEHPSRAQIETTRENRRAAMRNARSRRWSSTTNQAPSDYAEPGEDFDLDDEEGDDQLAETESASNRNDLSTALITRGSTVRKTTNTQPLPEAAETEVGGGGDGGNDGEGARHVSQGFGKQVERAVKLLALDELNGEINKGRVIKDKAQYLSGIRNRVRETDGPVLAEFAEANPGWTPRRLADALRPAPPPGTAPVAPRPAEHVPEPAFTGHRPDFDEVRADARRVHQERRTERNADDESDENHAAEPDPATTESEART